MPSLPQTAYAVAAEKKIWAYWLSWVRWMVAPALLFLYLSFILHVEVMPHKMDTLALATDFFTSLLAHGATAFALGLFIACLRWDVWAAEAQAWRQHKARVAEQEKEFAQRAAWCRGWIGAWALVGGAGVLVWPYFEIAALISVGLLFSLAYYVRVFWAGAPREGWFSSQLLSYLFFGIGVMVGSVLADSASNGIMGSRYQTFAYHGNFVLGESVVGNWFFGTLTMLWLLYVGLQASARSGGIPPRP